MVLIHTTDLVSQLCRLVSPADGDAPIGAAGELAAQSEPRAESVMGYALSDGQRKWTSGKVPFEVDGLSFPPGSAQLTVVQNAVNAWNSQLTPAADRASRW
jgi:hypothetical protein